MSTPSLLSDALNIAASGYPVHPVNLDKTPLTKNGFKDATTNEAQITEWWNKHPLAMIGIPTGRKTDLFVIDVDVKHGKDGRAALKALDIDLSQAPQSITPSGGSHYYLRLGGRLLRSTTGKLGVGLDTRGEGGFIVVPPSNPNPAKPGYSWVRDIPLSAAPVVPDKLVSILVEKTDE